MSAHTPGPWRIQPPMIQRTPRWLVVSDDGHVVADCGIAEKVPADARLIAAAPDLLAALSDLVDVIDRLGTVRLPKMDAARAAIAKAEGREP